MHPTNHPASGNVEAPEDYQADKVLREEEQVMITHVACLYCEAPIEVEVIGGFIPATREQPAEEPEVIFGARDCDCDYTEAEWQELTVEVLESIGEE
jgi:hypothetical protein